MGQNRIIGQQDHDFYLEKGKTINKGYCASLLNCFNKKSIVVHQDKLSHKRVHACARAKFQELGHELLPRPPYSLDIAPSDYFLFLNMTKRLSRKKNGSNDKTIAETKLEIEER